MDFMPIIPFLAVSLPESLVLYYMIFTLASKRVSFYNITILAIVTSLCSYGIRSLPIEFGFHVFLQLAIMAILLIIFCKIYWQTAIFVVLFAGIILGLAEGIILPSLAWIFSLTLNEIISDPWLRVGFALPHFLFLVGLTYVADKRQWCISLIKVTKSPLFILCLVQALMLVLLMISFHIYDSGVYPSFTVDILINIGIIIILISVLATVLVALYLLKSIEREAKLEANLYYAMEKDKLNMKVQAERHDLYNHITVMYGYMETKEYGQLKKYIEERFQKVFHIKSLLDINPLELSALLSVKKGEALEKGIDFNWQISFDNEILPVSPEELTQILGNLLDNALDAAAAKESNSPKKVELIFDCSNTGLELQVMNTGNPISPEIKDKIFTAGYTTKDKKQHSGLGLYIINETIKRLGGRLELKEPEDYPGVRFLVYIPWKD